MPDPRELGHDERDILEGFIDRHGLNNVLAAAALIAHLKAEHIASNWQDATLAKSWSKDAAAIEKVKVSN